MLEVDYCKCHGTGIVMKALNKTLHTMHKSLSNPLGLSRLLSEKSYGERNIIITSK